MTTPWRRARRRAATAVHLPIAFYLAFIGLVTLASNEGLDSTLPAWLTTVWCAALLIGAVLIFWGVIAEHTRAESAGLGFHLFGIALYALVHLSIVGGDDVVSLAVLAAIPIMRLRILSKARAAQREAGRVLGGRQS